jgi:DNA-binding NarL/FixJ family response regulator
MYNILIADDHPVVLYGTKTFLEQNGYQVICTCSNGLEAFNQIVTRQPDIALLDISMPGMNGLEITEKLSTVKNRTRVVLLTMHNELSLFNRAKELGVSGYLLKEFAMDELEKCLAEVTTGNTYFSKHLDHKLSIGNSEESEADLSSLTFAERKILQLVAQQKSSKEIASLLFISEKTVETHRSHIIKKLNLPPAKNALLIYALKMKQQI